MESQKGDVMSATIVFRGLMVFHYMDGVMEIGVLEDGKSGHVPRIITTKNGVVSSIFDLRSVDDFGHVRDWEIEVTNPLQAMATKFQQGDVFNRRNHPYERDFRWITDLEGSDLHDKDLSDDIDTSRIKTVLRVRHGEFYTRLLSKPLLRQNVRPPGQPIPYGMAAEVTGCDIAFNIGQLRLKAGNSQVLTFDEGVEDGVIYEFSNAPPDVPVDRPHEHGGHFHMYYHDLFKVHEPPHQFDLVPEDDPDPAPDPATCGATILGRRTGGI
jgi:hypothetical protein